SGATPAARGVARPLPGGRHEVQLVPSDALPLAAGGLPPALPQRVGRPAERPLRPAPRPPALQRVPRHARVRRPAGLRRGRGERATPERLRDDAVTEPDAGGPRTPLPP